MMRSLRRSRNLFSIVIVCGLASAALFALAACKPAGDEAAGLRPTVHAMPSHRRMLPSSPTAQPSAEEAKATARNTALLGLILFGAYLLNYILTTINVPQALAGMIKDFEATVETWEHKPKFERAISESLGGPSISVITTDEIYNYGFANFAGFPNTRDAGLVILDQSAHETSLQAMARQFRRLGTAWGVVRNLADTPLFIDSRASRMVQLADHVAYAVFRRYEHGDSQYFDVVASRFDSADGVVHGLVHRQNIAPRCMCSLRNRRVGSTSYLGRWPGLHTRYRGPGMRRPPARWWTSGRTAAGFPPASPRSPPEGSAPS